MWLGEKNLWVNKDPPLSLSYTQNKNIGVNFYTTDYLQFDHVSVLFKNTI